MTDEQIAIVKALRSCTTTFDSVQRRFLTDMAMLVKHQPTKFLSKQQDMQLRELAFRFRRQMPLGLLTKNAPHAFSTLQWMAPELVRGAFIKNEDWIPDHCAAAVELLEHHGLHTCATLMAALHRYALDYIRQAPVIVLGVSEGSRLHTTSERAAVAEFWRTRIAKGPKLRDLMTELGLPFQLRQLAGKSLSPALWAGVKNLHRVDPSTLAQIIPSVESRQFAWLQALSAWAHTMERRFNNESQFFYWAACAISKAVLEGGHGIRATDIADLAGTHPDRFNERWTFLQALDAADRWHEELAKADGEQRFFLQHGFQWDQPIDYGTLPIEIEINDYKFVALRSGQDLFIEGQAMHHCVGSYSKDVISGRSRIYSICKGEQRIATFELGGTDKVQTFGEHGVMRWHPLQLKGPCNAKPAQTVFDATEVFVFKINDRLARQEKAA